MSTQDDILERHAILVERVNRENWAKIRLLWTCVSLAFLCFILITGAWVVYILQYNPYIGSEERDRRYIVKELELAHTERQQNKATLEKLSRDLDFVSSYFKNRNRLE